MSDETASSKQRMLLAILSQMGREAMAHADGARDAALDAMVAKVAENRELHFVLAVAAVDSIIEAQMEKRYGPVQGIA